MVKMTTQEMLDLFEVSSFAYGFCFVTRKSDGVKGMLEFDHAPRFYYNFVSID